MLFSGQAAIVLDACRCGFVHYGDLDGVAPASVISAPVRTYGCAGKKAGQRGYAQQVAVGQAPRITCGAPQPLHAPTLGPMRCANLAPGYKIQSGTNADEGYARQDALRIISKQLLFGRAKGDKAETRP